MPQESLELDDINYSGVEELDRPGVPPGMTVCFISIDSRIMTIPGFLDPGAGFKEEKIDNLVERIRKLQKAGRRQN